MGVMNDIESPIKDGPPIIDSPILFKHRLNIGDDAYEYLKKTENFSDFAKTIFAGVGGSSLFGAAWIVTLTPIAKFALLFGLVSSPVGWCVGAGALSSVLAYALIKQGKNIDDIFFVKIPIHVNTPLDFLGQCIISLTMPAVVRMSLADGHLCAAEREVIVNNYAGKWGFNRDFIDNSLTEQESCIANFDYEEYRQLLTVTTCTHAEIKYDVIKNELLDVIGEVMKADGSVSTSEIDEFERLNNILNQPAEIETDGLKEDILASVKRRTNSFLEVVNAHIVLGKKIVGEDNAGAECQKDELLQNLEKIETHDLTSLLISGFRIPDKKIAYIDREGLILMCSKELRSAAGSSTRNLFRNDHEFPYKQILIDVADRLADGFTPASWTDYKLSDSHTEKEIEESIISCFEERSRKWWNKLPQKKKDKFVDGLQSVLDEECIEKIINSGGVKTVLTQQLIDSIIQNGVVLWLTKISVSGPLGVLGMTVVTHIGWTILLQTIGFMSGIKIALLGIGGMGPLGGAVSFLGATAVGGALSIPSALLVLDGPAYRKTIPTVIMLLAMSRSKVAAPVVVGL